MCTFLPSRKDRLGSSTDHCTAQSGCPLSGIPKNKPCQVSRAGAKLLETLGTTCCVRPLSHWTNQLGQLIWTKISRLGHFSTHQAPIHTITPSGSFLLTPPRLITIFLLLIFLQRTRGVLAMSVWLVCLLGLIEPNCPHNNSAHYQYAK